MIINDIINIIKENVDIDNISQGKVSKKIKENCKKNYIENRQNNEEIRFNNLQIVTSLLKKNNIEYWLQGKTLVGITKNNTLLEDDHDDDIGIWCDDLGKLIKNVHKELVKNNFIFIRVDNGIISYFRNSRWLDICLFYNNNNKITGYGKKKFKKEYYSKFLNIEVNPCNNNKYTFQVPFMYNNIIKDTYENIESNMLYKLNNIHDYCICILWPHSFKKLNKIIKEILNNYEIIFIKHKYFNNISMIIDKIYENENKAHIKKKTEYLNNFDGKIGIILLKSKNINYKQIVDFKWKLRTNFNPRFPNKENIPAKFVKYTKKYNSEPEDVITHHHIIHFPDNLKENKYLIKLFNIKYVIIKDQIYF
jgi:hypothetical protein